MASDGGCKKSSPGQNVPVGRTAKRLEPPGWTDGEGLELRLDRQNRDILWLRRHRTEKPALVYRVHCGTADVTVATEDEWSAASSEIRDCAEPQGHPPVLHRDSPSLKLKRGDEIVPTAGEFVSALRWLRGGRCIAVVSADGPLKGVTYVGWGSARPTGQHYHQTFSLETGAFVGEPVRLPVDEAESGFGLCFAPKERYVVYYSKTALCIIELDCGGDAG